MLNIEDDDDDELEINIDSASEDNIDLCLVRGQISNRLKYLGANNEEKNGHCMEIEEACFNI